MEFHKSSFVLCGLNGAENTAADMVYLVVAVDKLSELVREDASSIREGEPSAWQYHLQSLLEITGCSLKETNHQLLGKKSIAKNNNKSPTVGKYTLQQIRKGY